MTITLGLDLGPNSIGWALTEEEGSGHGRIVDLGVRIFPEGVENFDTKKEKPRNEERRLARMMRRQVRRRADRKRKLRQTLIDQGLFPADAQAQRDLYDLNPYALRAKALDEALTPHEFGRILLHLNQRRGFLSNRKSERKGSEVQGMLTDIEALGDQIKESGARTYGEYMYQKAEAIDHTARANDDHLRGRHTQRRWLTEEFTAIWQAQQTHHPSMLTEALAYGTLGKGKGIQHPIPKHDDRRGGAGDLESFGLFGLVFFHRTLKPVPKDIIGACELEPKKKRCPRADRAAQRFRLLQEVNNLRLIDESLSPAQERELYEQERTLVLDKLINTKEASFDQIRGWIGKLPDSPAAEQIRFNLEEGKRTKLKGMVTDGLLSAKTVLGKDWHRLGEHVKNEVVRALIDNIDDGETLGKLIDLGLSEAQAEAALSLDLTAGPTKGYANVSRVAIEKLLPHLEKGMRLMANDEKDSALHAAGYLRRDQLQRRIFDTLPDLSRIQNAPIGDIPNPVVKRAIVELRKVVNAILREQRRKLKNPSWRPDAVHVEMARQVQQSAAKRSEATSRMREREQERDKAKQFLSAHGQGYGARGANIIKVRLWEEQNNSCPYCGQRISQQQLFTDGLTDIDHILPYSQTLDDSQMNKVVCHRVCNADKGNRSPYDWLSGDPDRYAKVCQQAASLRLPYPKYKRFMQKEVKVDDFIARQLTATGYIAKATLEYIKCLFEDEHRVLGLKGQLTAELRRQWGLNDAIRLDGEDTKTRDDHRHHAVDALVVALTNRSRLHGLTKIRKAGGVVKTGESLEYPWEGLRDEAVAKLQMLDGGTDEDGNARAISHRVERKVSGGLHQDTVYSPVRDRHGQITPGKFAVRKPVESLSLNEIPNIRDKAIRKIVESRLADHGIQVGRGKKVDAKKLQQALTNLTMPSDVPIKKVRIERNEQTIQPIRTDQAERLNDPDRIAWVKPGATHHLCLFEFERKGKTKREAVFVTQLEAINRIKKQQRFLAERLKAWREQGVPTKDLKAKQARAMREIAEAHPLIQRDPSKLIGEDSQRVPNDARFVMSLSSGELVLAEVKGEQKILKYKTAASTTAQMRFVKHVEARKSSDTKEITFKPNTLNARKITVNPLGHLRWAND